MSTINDQRTRRGCEKKIGTRCADVPIKRYGRKTRAHRPLRLSFLCSNEGPACLNVVVPVPSLQQNNGRMEVVVGSWNDEMSFGYV